MLRLFVAFAVSFVIGLGAASAQVPAKKQPNKQPRTAEDVLKHKDANQDGKLSKEEFMKGVPEARKAAMEKRFAAMDADKDGSVSKQELKNAFEKMKERQEKGGKGSKGGKGGKGKK